MNMVGLGDQNGAKGLAAKAAGALNPKKEAARQRKAAQEASAEDRQPSFFPLGPLGLAGNTDREFRHGYYINPNPTCDLSTPPAPPPLTAEGRAEREAQDRTASGFISQNLAKYVDIVKNVSLFSEMGLAELQSAAGALQLRHFKAGDLIYDEGDEGNDCWVIESGVCVSSQLIPGITIPGTWEWKETRPYSPGKFGSFFGERGLLRKEPRATRIVCRTDVVACRIVAQTYVECARISEAKENLLRAIQLFETMTDPQIAKLSAAIEKRTFKPGEKILTEGEPGVGAYVIESGECVATNSSGATVRSYGQREIFGEVGLYGPDPNVTSVTAGSAEVALYSLSRVDFEARLGSLKTLKEKQFEADPRKLLSDFYQAGDGRGPAGTLAAKGLSRDQANTSSWFVVYRPCSRDSIAKMLGRVGVGKGLNIKGKSAKKNRLSGFVPFLQISDNSHKDQVEESPRDARTTIYYKNVMAREMANNTMAKVLRENAHAMAITEPEIRVITDYEPKAFGLDVPEPLMRYVYIDKADISPVIGWETGRPSVPQYMDMNLHSVRGDSRPSVCLYQHDLADPMNPLGLLIAYQEKEVKPVVSDFDTFTVGCRGIRHEPTPPDQVELIHWALDHTAELLKQDNTKGWTGHWLDVLKVENAKGFHPNLPDFGFGDPTSYRFVEDVVSELKECGAVRHGAECFNFYFPQELDPDFLIIWDGFANEPPDNPPWRTVTEPELRKFLLDRTKDGYGFPLNPIWPVRDEGWFEVLQALKSNPESAANMNAWFPPDSRVMEKIETLHREHPGCFK